MTSGSLYFKLLREDLKRRVWAIALVFLAFFFSLPIGLALSMENAANTDYFIYNGYKNFVQDGSLPDDLFQAKLLELKTKVVLSDAAFGNGLIVFLLIVAAVVIGVSSFSYLHNRKKIDFYHSIPVRRETLYSTQYTGGILIVGLCYLINLILMLGVALSYGVRLGSLIGPMAGGWALNMLYFLLMYAVVVVAMMMTGNMVVGLLGSGVFFFFLPAIMMLLAAYCETFFLTTARSMWSSEDSPFMWGMKYLSPFSVYMTALSWGVKNIGKHIPELICTGFGFLAFSLLGLQLYRKRPSEAAGRAMAFKRTMAPIRMILVIGCGLAGCMFFWSLQSNLKWGLFGIVVAVILTHCIVEIIYHFDFKKLFGHRVQLVICLAAGVLAFLSFRYDWYGYDSYMPQADRIASASLEIGIDSNWLDSREITISDSGEFGVTYKAAYEEIEKNMKLTDMGLVLPIAEEGRRNAIEDRKVRLGSSRTPAYANTRVSYIGGADGPTSVFVAGKVAGEENETDRQMYYTNVTVNYRLTNGRRVRRAYSLYLSDIMDTYEKLYSQTDYKTGLYRILSQTPEQLSRAYYKEAGTIAYTAEEGSVLTELLKAYQTDLMALDTQTRIQEAPIGSICFVTKDSVHYLKKGIEDSLYKYRGGYWDYRVEDFNQYWPIYPSFTRTIQILESQGEKPGTFFAPEQVKEITINVQNLLKSSYSDIPQEEELAELQKKNPYYQEDGSLHFTDAHDIALLMDAMMEEEYYQMDQFHQPAGGFSYCQIELKGNQYVSGLIMEDRVTPEMLDLFAGIPMEVE